jgi:hypothetical protein
MPITVRARTTAGFGMPPVKTRHKRRVVDCLPAPCEQRAGKQLAGDVATCPRGCPPPEAL